MCVINLRKNQVISLKKINEGLKELTVGLGWKVNSNNKQFDYDLDVSVFMLKNNKLVSDTDFIFYNNLRSRDESVIHTGDDRKGSDGVNDCEQVIVNTEKIDKSFDKLIFVISIHDAQIRNQNFSVIQDAYVRLVDTKNNQELLRYNLESSPYDMCLNACELVLEDGEWIFKAVTNGYRFELDRLIGLYYTGGVTK